MFESARIAHLVDFSQLIDIAGLLISGGIAHGRALLWLDMLGQLHHPSRDIEIIILLGVFNTHLPRLANGVHLLSLHQPVLKFVPLAFDSNRCGRVLSLQQCQPCGPAMHFQHSSEAGEIQQVG